jgi:hypothetical protein
MPIVEQTAPIGIQRHFKDSSTATIGENLKKKINAIFIQFNAFRTSWREWIGPNNIY